jgi:transcriptional regulator with XRE-family HTH domain
MNKLQELRKNNGDTQKTLAELLGVSEMTISRWEKEKELKIKYDYIQKLAKHFKVSIGYLLGYEDNFDYVSKKAIQALDKVKDQASSQGITNYEDLERIAEADRIIKEFLKDSDKSKRYQESFPLKLSLAIQELIDLDNIKQTDYAKLLINYQVLEKSDQIKIFEIIDSLATKTTALNKEVDDEDEMFTTTDKE